MTSRQNMATQIAAWSPLPDPGCSRVSTPNSSRPTQRVAGSVKSICHCTAPAGSSTASGPVKTKVIWANHRQNNPKYRKQNRNAIRVSGRHCAAGSVTVALTVSWLTSIYRSGRLCWRNVRTHQPC